jgi:flagellar biosynthesis/type III secretory pathway protein FliH
MVTPKHPGLPHKRTARNRPGIVLNGAGDVLEMVDLRLQAAGKAEKGPSRKGHGQSPFAVCSSVASAARNPCTVRGRRISSSSFKRHLILSAAAQRFREGVREGFREGMREGFREGVREGFREGMREGFREGMREGYAEGGRAALQKAV